LEREKMKTNINRLVAALALIVLLSSSASLIQSVNAHTPSWTIPTYAYIAVTPNPIGVGQTAFVTFWLDWVPPGAGGIGGDRWRNLTVDVTKPDGSKEMLGPFTSDPIGGAYDLYTPDQIGTYTFKFNFPGQNASMYGPTGEISVNPSLWDYINDTFLPSSAVTTLNVQQEEVKQIPDYPLPTEYWVRPIEGQNTAWAKIASNYLAPFGAAYVAGSDRFQPDGVAPDSPHIMWTKPLAFGGVVGGSNTEIPEVAFYTGLSYESRFSTPIIIYGRLYYALPLGNNAVGGGYVCVDLNTGETLWWQNYTVNPTFGQLYDYESSNQHGVIPNGYLWASTTSAGVTTWMAYDPMTGLWLFNMTNVPSGTRVYNKDGSINVYVLDATNKWLALWDSSAAPDGPLVREPGTGTNAYQYRPIGKNANMSTAYAWNVTIPSSVPATSSIRKVIPGDMVMVSTSTTPMYMGWGSLDYTVSAISLKSGSEGQLLWTKTYPAPEGNLTRQWGPVDAETRVFTMNDKETMQWLGYSIDDGSLLWGPVGETRAFNYYPTIGMGGSGPAGFVAYGNLYVGGYGGEEFCYSMKTGDLLWTYNNTSSGHETPWGNYPIFPAAIADGKIYLYSGEHSPNSPEYKGSRVRCLNAMTGEELWTMLSWGSVGSFADEGWPVADDSIVYLNTYDMQIYCLSKGPSAITVDAPMTGVTTGKSMVIRGTVTDISAGTKQDEQAARFPNGVPAVSDASIGEWMEYVYMQKPMPNDVTGVTVHLTAVDPTGNSQDLGYAVSDALGNYVFEYTPSVSGLYIVTATFEGTNSYYGSKAGTSFVASGTSVAPVPTGLVSPFPSEAPQPTSGTQTPIYIAIGAAVVIIAVVAAAVLLRRRR
jgi:outer membrane protein assembly factor BamB